MLSRFVVLVALLLASGTDARAEGKESESEMKTMLGMSAKVRRSYATKEVQELFLDGTPGNATMDGAGIDFARRRGPSEVVFGFGYDQLDAKNGFYLGKGNDPLTPGDVDLVTRSEERHVGKG